MMKWKARIFFQLFSYNNISRFFYSLLSLSLSSIVIGLIYINEEKFTHSSLSPAHARVFWQTLQIVKKSLFFPAEEKRKLINHQTVQKIVLND
jgi:hypothetical protein